jgi:murein DD-endopeptidase MepM/ murein hydrolase activator NlpD
MHRPPNVYVRAGGTYPGTDIPRGQLRRHLDIQAAPWSSVRESARNLATRALTGSVPNPGIGLASEFASTRIYFRQRHGRDPSPDEWRQYTIETAARRRWRWVGPVPGIDQMKNAFFLDLRAARLPTDAVVVQPPTQIQADLSSPSPSVQTGVDPHQAGAPAEHKMAEEDGPPRDIGVPFAPDPPPGSSFPVRSTHPRGAEVSYTTTDGRQVGRSARQFGASRSNGRRRHAGIDLFARLGDEVIACQDGRIVSFYGFCCGEQQTSWALIIDHGTVAINYGEVAPDSLSRLGLARGATVRAGQVVAYIGQNPGGSSMLHFETYTTGTSRNYSWPAGSPPPARLLDPTRYLLALEPSRTAPPTTHPILRRGSTGPAVRDLQRALTAAGFPATVDGAFGLRTDAAVRALQRARGLTPDGVVGPLTWAALGRTEAPGLVVPTSGEALSQQAWGDEGANQPGEAGPGEAVTGRFGLYDGLDLYRATT